MQCLVCELREQRNSMNLSIQKNMEVLNRKWKGYRNPWFALLLGSSAWLFLGGFVCR